MPCLWGCSIRPCPGSLEPDLGAWLGLANLPHDFSRMLVIPARDEDLVLSLPSIRYGGCSGKGDDDREVADDFWKSHPRHGTQSVRMAGRELDV